MDAKGEKETTHSAAQAQPNNKLICVVTNKIRCRSKSRMGYNLWFFFFLQFRILIVEFSSRTR